MYGIFKTLNRIIIIGFLVYFMFTNLIVAIRTVLPPAELYILGYVWLALIVITIGFTVFSFKKDTSLTTFIEFVILFVFALFQFIVAFQWKSNYEITNDTFMKNHFYGILIPVFGLLNYVFTKKSK